MIFSKNQIHGHKFRAHGIKNPLRKKISGTACTRNKLIHHVCYLVKKCRLSYVDQADLSNEQYEKEECEAAASRKSLKSAGRNPLYCDKQVNQM